MKNRTGSIVIIVTALIALASVPAFALKLLKRITPASASAEGFAVKVTHREKGVVGFEMERDLSKKEWPGRSAILKLGGEANPIAVCILEPKITREKDSDVVRYRFNVGEKYLAVAHLTYIEDQNRPGDREKIIGGGTYFEFSPLSEFVEPEAAVIMAG